MSIKLKQHKSTQTKDDGTVNFIHPLAFATLADNETFHYGDAMNQHDISSFITAMVKEADDLTKTGVWVLQRHSKISYHNLICAIWSFKCKRAPNR
jgi:hypothetical protein